MAWHIVEKLLEQTAEHSTLVGKFWVTFFFVLRFLLVVSIVDTVFGDEQDKFVCNTLTPGCENVCYNDFSPISLIRLWSLQILCVALPTVIFITYTAHKLTKIEQAKKIRKEMLEKRKKEKQKAKEIRKKHRKDKMKRRMVEGGPPQYNEVDVGSETDAKDEEEKKDKKDEDEEKVVAAKSGSDTPSRLMIAYVAQVLLRLTMEIGFTIIQYNTYVFKFWIPELFKCSRWPCPNVVDCFVSRPKEKTLMLWIMFGTSLIMIVLNVVELYHLGARKIWSAWKDRGQDITKEYKISSNEPSFGHHGRYGGRYPRGYPQAVGIRVGYARSSISGEGGNDFAGDRFI